MFSVDLLTAKIGKNMMNLRVQGLQRGSQSPSRVRQSVLAEVVVNTLTMEEAHCSWVELERELNIQRKGD